MAIDGWCYFTKWKDLPHLPGIYYVLRDDRTPLYYGEASHLLNRWRVHKTGTKFDRLWRDLRQDFLQHTQLITICWTIVRSKATRLQMEWAMLQAWPSLYNIQHNPARRGHPVRPISPPLPAP